MVLSVWVLVRPASHGCSGARRNPHGTRLGTGAVLLSFVDKTRSMDPRNPPEPARNPPRKVSRAFVIGTNHVHRRVLGTRRNPRRNPPPEQQASGNTRILDPIPLSNYITIKEQDDSQVSLAAAWTADFF